MSTLHDDRPFLQGSRRTHALLSSGVPLSLLLDLLDPRGPRSAELYAAEAADREWLPDRTG